MSTTKNAINIALFITLNYMMRKLQNDELGRLSVEEFHKMDKNPIVVVLDNIRSMNNIGSVFRTADAFLVEKVFLCGITATPPHGDIHKTALGATESVAWEYVEDTLEVIERLQEAGYSTYAVEQAEGSVSLESLGNQKGQKVAVVFGHEVRGVQQDVVDACKNALELPQFGTKHSLNISVCAGIVLWELAQAYLKP